MNNYINMKNRMNNNINMNDIMNNVNLNNNKNSNQINKNMNNPFFNINNSNIDLLNNNYNVQINNNNNQINNKINDIINKNINVLSNNKTKQILEQNINNNLLNNEINNKVNEELDKLRKENSYLKKELKELKEEFNNEKKRNQQLSLKIKELNEIIKKEKDNNLKGTNFNNNKMIDLYEELRAKEKEIKNIKSKFPFELSENEELMSVIFISSNQKIHYSIICKNTDQFTKIETQLYKEFPDYGDLENLFFINGNKINKYKTLKDNNIKNSDIITLYNFDE